MAASVLVVAIAWMVIAATVPPAPSTGEGADAVPGGPNGWEESPPVDDPDALKPGLIGEYFRDPEFDQRALARIDPQIDFDWGYKQPTPLVPSNSFSVRWQGYLRAPQAGEYTLALIHDNGVRLILDGKVLVDQLDRRATGRATASVVLDDQPHRLELEFVEGRLTAWCRLHWLRNGDENFPEQPIAPECLFHTMRQIADLDVAVLPKPAPTHSATAAPGAHPVLVDPGTLRPGLWGEYFADIGFTKFVMARTDTAINFDWRDRSPHPDMPKDNFGVRWRGFLQAPAAGKYTIVVLGDDGVRVRLDHENIIDELDTWGRVRRTADVELDNKPHELHIDFREQDNHAWCQLRWSREGKDGFEEKPIEGGFLFHTPEQAQRNPAGE